MTAPGSGMASAGGPLAFKQHIPKKRNSRKSSKNTRSDEADDSKPSSNKERRRLDRESTRKRSSKKAKKHSKISSKVSSCSSSTSSSSSDEDSAPSDQVGTLPNYYLYITYYYHILTMALRAQFPSDQIVKLERLSNP